MSRAATTGGHDPATLQAVLDMLGEHIDGHEEMCAADDAGPAEIAARQVRLDTLKKVRRDVQRLLADTNPNARVVVLPAPCGQDDDGQVYFDDYTIRVDTTGSTDPSWFPNVVVWQGVERTPEQAYALGLEFLGAGVRGGAR